MDSFDSGRIEKRSVQFTEAEIVNDGGMFVGYAAIYGQEADLGDWTEEVGRGAFRKVLAGKPNIPMYWDHDARIPPLATTRSGTLRLKEDAKGLRVEADLDDDHYMTPTLRSMIRRGDVQGMSFGFVAGAGNSRVENRGGKPHRVITGFNHLLDVSPTWQPAYAETTAELRSALGQLRSAEDNDESQQVSTGAYQQLGDGATDEDDTQSETTTQESGADEAAEKVTVEVTVEKDQQDQDQEDSGVEADSFDENAATARSRYLQMSELSLLKKPF